MPPKKKKLFHFPVKMLFRKQSLPKSIMVAAPVVFCLLAAGVASTSTSAKYVVDQIEHRIGIQTHPDRISAIFQPSVRRWEPLILRWSDNCGLDPNLVATVMQIESCGNPDIVSPAGAQGLFQVMSFHFKDEEEPLDPDTNARRGVEYLATALLKAEGQISRALAGYNGGHGWIEKDRTSWPAETKRYVYWGEGIYTEAVSGVERSQFIEEWLSAGGSRLCATATS